MLVLIKGAGDLASGVALRLVHAGFQVVMTEIAKPTCVRRTAAFCPAVTEGRAAVEDVTAVLAGDGDAALRAAGIPNQAAVVVDPLGEMASILKPDALVDAILAKRNTGTRKQDAPIVIACRPGFTAGRDCHAVVETKRGHTLGRVIWAGEALANTGVPGEIAGFTTERLLRAPGAGVFYGRKVIGDLVKKGDCCGIVAADTGEETEVTCQIAGILRGLLAEGTQVTPGMKAGDVDPRAERDHCFTVSDKALSVGGGVLEALCALKNRR